MSQYSDGSLDLSQRNTSWTKVYEYVSENSRVLDVGCSSGNLGRELIKRKKCEVYGIEIDQKDFEAAKKVLKDVYKFNLEVEPFPDALSKLRFDVIILADVIEHLVDPAEALRKLKGLLSPGGRIVYSIPNMSHVSVRLQLLMGKFNYANTGLLDKTHLHFYDYDEVQRVMARAGLQIEHNDANSLPYTVPYLEGLLKKVGLADKGFIKQIQKDPIARTFQFVGFAVPAKDPKNIKQIPLHTSTPEQDFVEYSHKIHAEDAQVRSTNVRLSQRIQTLQSQNNKLLLENQDLKLRLARYTNSLLWQTAKFVSKPIRKKR